MQLGHDDLGSRNTFSSVNLGRNPAAVVMDCRRSVRIEDDADLVGMAGERFVDGVVDDFVDHMMESGAIVGVADVHARALADRVEAFQDLDRLGAVFAIAFSERLGFVHTFPFWRRVERRSLGPSGALPFARRHNALCARESLAYI